MELEQASNLYKPSLPVADEQPQQNFDHNLGEIELMSLDQYDNVQVIDDLQMVAAPGDTCYNGADVAVREEGGIVDGKVKIAEAEKALGKGKRKRGRLPGSGQVKKRQHNQPSRRRKKDEEDVCFICFDGGDLVLCDRKGCPKAYHTTCIKRDNAFFQSKSKWTCGWHLCYACRKASYYTCYTCTYSLCKGCTKDADFFSVRGNKGFCGVCLRTIMLIEDCAPGEKVEVDFEDQSSFEYLFKVYWVCLKEKFLFTKDELIHARGPWKQPAITAPKRNSSGKVGGNCNKRPSLENFCGDLGTNHFLIQGNSSVVNAITRVADVVMSQVEAYENHDNQLVMGNDKGCKISKEAYKRESHANPDEYAAIDVHNINLIYLKRSLMENLFVEGDQFHDKVVGSIVRIQLPGSDQKQDMYRLVQVIGTIKAAEPYKIGERTTDVMLEICNLQKKEVVSIDTISNHEFSKDECKWLCQSIKCGFINRLTVGEIQDKAISLHALRVNDLLESEILRLSNLRDRASEKGYKRELEECVEKLQILNSPEERNRRLLEIPKVHADPNMYHSYESEEDAEELDEKQGNHVDGSPLNQGKEPNNLVGSTILVTGGWSNNAVRTSKSSSRVSSEELSPSNSVGMTESIIDFETQDFWHYQDPYEKIHGPFPVVQLRKWRERGHFPSDLHVWGKGQQQDDSILLTDALNGQYDKELLKKCLILQEVRDASDDTAIIQDQERSGSMDTVEKDIKRIEGCMDSIQHDRSAHSKTNDDGVKSNGGGCQSSSLTTTVDVISKEEKIGSILQGSDSLKYNHALPEQPPVCNSLPLPMLAKKPCESMLHQVKEKREGELFKSDQNSLNGGFQKTTGDQINLGNGNDKRVDIEDNSGQFSGQNCKLPPIDNSSNGWDSNSFASFAKPLEMSDQNKEIDFSDLPSPTLKPNHVNLKDQDAGPGTQQSVPIEAPAQDLGPSWSSVTSPESGGSHLSDVVGEWGGYSPTQTKPSVEEWDADLIPAVSSLKPTEVGSDHAATPTSGSCQRTHSSPSHPASNAAAGWQAIVIPEPEEFTTLADESVSDLLAEVEAMESRNRFASPTSALRCGVELAQGSENDCFSPIGGLSPTPDLGSSSSDLQMHSHSTVTDEPLGVSQADGYDLRKSSGGHSSTSADVEEDAKPNDDSINQSEVGSRIQPPLPSVMSWDIDAMDSWRLGSETANICQGTVQGNANLAFGGLGQGIKDMGLGTDQWTGQDYVNMNIDTSIVNHIWESQPRYVGDSLSGPRDHDFNGGDSSFERGRLVWNGPEIYDFGNGDASFELPPKDQRCCKYYESGYCKKGASCGFWHA